MPKIEIAVKIMKTIEKSKLNPSSLFSVFSKQNEAGFQDSCEQVVLPQQVRQPAF